MEADEILQTIARAIHSLQFGTLEIVIHDSKVVRIERRERIRLDVDRDGDREGHTQHPTGKRGTTTIDQA